MQPNDNTLISTSILSLPKTNRLRFSFVVMLGSLFLTLCVTNLYAIQRGKKSKSHSSKKTITSHRKQPTIRKKSSQPSRRKAVTTSHSSIRSNTVTQSSSRRKKQNLRSLKKITIESDSVVTDGIIYRRMGIEHSDNTKSIVHTLTCVLRSPAYSISTLKAENRVDGLEKMYDLVQRTDSLENKKVFAAVNAHFWKAVTNAPIGPTIINGDVVEMLQHKSWQSIFFDSKGKPTIDTFKLSCFIRNTSGDTLTLMSVNRRLVEDSVVLYNSYIGSRVPYKSGKNIDDAISEILDDSIAVAYDSTITMIQSDSLKTALQTQQMSTNDELKYAKLLVRYLRTPQVNQDIPMLVLKKVDSGAVTMPIRGAVLTMSKKLLKSLFVGVGDTVFVRYKTNILDTVQFENSVCGTPRLVANGYVPDAILNNEFQSRFYNSRLARTAVGTDITQQTLYMVTVESNGRSSGFTIEELAEFLKKFGAYNALNLDGGGSSQMMIGTNTVSAVNQKHTRRISVALCLSAKKNNLRGLKRSSNED